MRILFLILLLAVCRVEVCEGALSGYPSNWANNGTTNADLAGNGTANAMVLTNGVTIPGVTVANLGSASPAGVFKYSSDCLAPWGTGSAVVSDGSNWRLVSSGVVATTSSETYLLSVLKIGKINGDGQYDFGWVDRYSGAASSTVGTYLLRIATVTGAGASISAAGVNVTGSAGALTMTSGTTATGLAGWKTADFYLVNQGYDLCPETVFNLSALSTATDEYWLLFSLTSNATVGDTSDANVIGLLYDRAATWGAGGTITNWKILTKKVGVGQTITESSTAVATGLHSLRIYVTAGGTTAHFYVDGTQVGGDVTSNLPASLSNLRLAFEMKNTAHAGASITANQIVNGYAGRRTAVLSQ